MSKLPLVAAMAIALFAFPGVVVAQITPWVDLLVEEGAMFVETEIAGVAGYALIDTGAEINGINESFTASVGESFDKGRKVRIAGVFDVENRNTYKNIPVRIFGSELDFVDLVEVNIGSPEVQMILGSGFLGLLVFQFDYPNQRMRAISRDLIDIEEISSVKSKRDRNGGSPLVRVRLNDEKDVWLLLDTGNTGGILLSRKFAKKRGWLDRYEREEIKVAGINSSGTMERFTISSVKIGDYTLDDPVITIPADGEKLEIFKETSNTRSRVKRSRSIAEGIIGYDVLKHFVLTIDYKDGHVHVEPPQ